MGYFLEQAGNALSLGGIYALLAIGLAVVYSILGLINFAHGALMTLTGYILVFTASASLPKTMDLVRNFLFEKGLLGNGAPSADVIGIEMPDGKILGDTGNVKLRFTETYMKAAAAGSL
jgi:ABC-type branched-subunit amino acid transport system permease subunit